MSSFSLKQCLLLLCLGVLTACTNGTPTPTPLPSTAGPLPTAVVSVLPSPTSPPSPKNAAEAYLAAWSKNDYATMYALLAPESQATVTPEDFEKRYRDNLTIMTVTGVAMQGLSDAPPTETAQVTAHVQYATLLVGTLEADLNFTLKKVGETWRVMFDPALIWPDLVNGQKLYMVYFNRRGTLYDRNAAPLAAPNVEAYAVGAVPIELEDPVRTARLVGDLLGLPTSTVLERIQNAPPENYLALGEVAQDEIKNSRLSFLLDMPGLRWTAYTASRFYYGNGSAAHVTGYTIYIPDDQFPAYQARGYAVDQRIGQTGLEEWGEAQLSGENGGQLVLLGADNSVLRTLAIKQAPVESLDIYSTVDRDLQRAAQFALGDFTGAVVVLDVQTGAVLALASNPRYDPNLFDGANLNAQFADTERQSRGLLNHATQDAYAAGSVFKIVTMGAALNSGLFTPTTEYRCTGLWEELGESFVLHDWKEDGHGRVTLQEGLSGSCNPWFWHIGKALFDHDPKWLSKTAKDYGLGATTGISQLAEIPGQIPGPDWKLQNKGEAWSVFDNLNLSIGQGDVLVTPIQIARMAAAVANGGTLYQPQLVLKVGLENGAPTFEMQPIKVGQLPLTAEQVAAIQEGMYNVMRPPIGTARNRFRNLPTWLKVAGKTGTAEVGINEPDAWFAGYTFANRPGKADIAIAVLVRNQGQGSAFAAPIFRRVLEAYFDLRLTVYPWEVEVGVTRPEETPTPTPGPDGEIIVEATPTP